MNNYPLIIKITGELEEVLIVKRSDNKINDKEINDRKEIIKRIKELSPKSIRKNVSNENFMKFQWSWTI